MQQAPITVHPRLFGGKRPLHIALLGMPHSGKSTLFEAVSSTAPAHGELSDTQRAYSECLVEIGPHQARLVDLPSVQSLHHPEPHELATLKYLLWGDQQPPITAHEGKAPPAPFAAPDVIIQIADATNLQKNLELTLELAQLGRPLVLALNMMDEAKNKGLAINCQALSKRLGVPVIPTVATMGQGIGQLFETALTMVQKQQCPLPQPASRHIQQRLIPLDQALNQAELQHAFRVPMPLLLTQLAAGEAYFIDEMQHHFPQRLAEIQPLRQQIAQQFERSLDEELHADRHHRAALLYEAVTRYGVPGRIKGWRDWLDALFLDPRWGLFGSLLIFALVLFVVFEVSAWLDALSAAPLMAWLDQWQPDSLGGVIGRAVADGLVGLIGIVVPYMLPLVLLLVALEESGIMHRIAFVLDRSFHHIGLHGQVAIPFLLGLGCNVPAISAAATTSHGRERVIASLLITFVPCSARSAVILALAGKYLGGLGVFALFMLTLLVIAVMGKLLTRRYPRSGPGQVQAIPPYTLPRLNTLLGTTWTRTKDILTIVTPLLVAGSVVLALLAHVGADQLINTLLMPVTQWWLGLPLVLGVPILFGILRKELSLLMIFQALGTFEVGQYLDWVQITTFLVFLTFYIPCVATFAVMVKTLGRKEALFSIGLSVVTALVLSGGVRLLLEGYRVLVQ